MDVYPLVSEEQPEVQLTKLELAEVININSRYELALQIDANIDTTAQVRLYKGNTPVSYTHLSVTGNSIVVIFLAVGIYIVLAGPVMYFVLKKKDRRELGWITIPVLSVVFFGVVFLLAGRSTYHNGMISTKAIVEMEQDSSIGEAQIAMAMKVPGNGDVTLESELPIPVQPQVDSGWYDAVSYTHLRTPHLRSIMILHT